jgi:hypothetical protein
LASASGWTTGKSLTIANSSGGKLYIKDASNLDLAQIISQENPTYSASLQADGLLVFTAPSVGITYSSWLAASGQNATSTTLLEYAWGAASVGALQSQNLPTYTLSSPRFVLNYVVRKNANVTVTPELSLSLSGVSSNFTSSPLITEVSEGFSTVDGVDIEHREASINLNKFAPKAFLRLRVSIPSQATP